MSAATAIRERIYARLLSKYLPRPIRTAAEYKRFTALLLELDEDEHSTPEQDALAEMLTLLIKDYEERRYPLPSVAPDKSKGAATEILNGRRSAAHGAAPPDSISKARGARLR
jgi:hypothetical protein